MSRVAAEAGAVQVEGELINHTLWEFLDEIASREPVPGGGSVSALAGAAAASLAVMAAEITMTKKEYASVAPEVETLARRAASLKAALTFAVDEDSEAYASV
ncbi:MAG TPA: cyclodeaminase/cyclohydrolase family protein, partial [Chthonomonadales bacterium]|nr:cyclodeaminase/cyclohydrolase family protein [Chthonomonadales bacterium]